MAGRTPMRLVPNDWTAQLNRGPKGNVKKDPSNISLILRNDEAWAGVIGFNEFKGEMEFIDHAPIEDGEPGEIEEVHMTRIGHWIERNYGFVPVDRALHMCVQEVAYSKRFHPVQQYLEHQTWDGTKRVDKWLATYMGAKDTTLNEAFGRCFLIGLVARVMKPGCKVDTALILEGPQGVKKSSALRKLVGDAWFAELNCDFKDKDSVQNLRGKWLIELAELSNVTRSQVEVVKSYMSTQIDRIRPSYARKSVDIPRHCGFAGTTNDTRYLNDATGNRRFWPVKVGEIDVDAIERDRHQLFAEAYDMFCAGMPWHLHTQELVNLAGTEQKVRVYEDPWAIVIRKKITLADEQCGVLVSDILTNWLNLETQHQHPGSLKRVSNILNKLGFARKVESDDARYYKIQ